MVAKNGFPLISRSIAPGVSRWARWARLRVGPLHAWPEKAPQRSTPGKRCTLWPHR